MERNSSLSDSELMLRVRKGNRLAFKEIYVRHGNRVYGYLWRLLGDEDLVEDLRQETFIRLWQQRGEWKERGTVAAFLIRVARNLALNARRNQKVRRRWQVAMAASLPAAAPAAENASEYQNLVERVNAAIEALPPQAREVFSLKRDAGFSYAEIAAALKISPKTVEAHMAKAFKGLRSSLRDLRE